MSESESNPNSKPQDDPIIEDGYRIENHKPGNEQMQGGSWIFNCVTGKYHMVSSYVVDGRMGPSPSHPNVYHQSYMISAEMAKTGNYELLDGLMGEVPELYLRPNEISESTPLLAKWPKELCMECKVVLDRAMMEIVVTDKSEKDELREHLNLPPQLDVDMKPDLPSLEVSAGKGCTFCRFLLDSFQTVSSHTLHQHLGLCGEDRSPIQVVGVQGRNSQYWFMVWLRRGKDLDLLKRTKVFDLCASIPTGPETFREYASNIGVRLSAKDLLSDRVVKIIRLWLDDCSEHHVACTNFLHKVPQLPKRVIEVGNVITEPRLIETNGLRGEYLTLSYCWGTVPNSRTTSSNLEERMKGIPLANLTPTIRHAILLTRLFGFQYLWVDALCIIQESQTDWNEQSVLMADIFGHSHFTIAASRAQSTYEGIFPAQFDRPDPLKYDIGRKLFVDTVPLDWNTCVENDVLNQRAWVLQERLLARRTLFFSAQQVFWECRTTRASLHQYSDIADEDNLTKNTTPLFNSIPERPEHIFRPVHGSKADHEHWYRTLEIYSRKSMTKMCDKLPALAGLARIFQRADDAYLAGIWIKDWRNGLCWRSASVRGRRRIEEPGRAPSWSWACLEGMVEFLQLEASPQEEQEHIPNASTRDTQTVKETTTVNEQVQLAGEEEQQASNPRATADRLRATLISTSQSTSDYLGQAVEITLEIEAYTDFVLVRSGTRELSPPSTYNRWIGTYDDLTANWIYRLDTDELIEPVRCLRLILGCEDDCHALLLLPTNTSEQKWRRVGHGVAKPDLVDFSKLGLGEKSRILLV